MKKLNIIIVAAVVWSNIQTQLLVAQDVCPTTIAYSNNQLCYNGQGFGPNYYIAFSTVPAAGNFTVSTDFLTPSTMTFVRPAPCSLYRYTLIPVVVPNPIPTLTGTLTMPTGTKCIFDNGTLTQTIPAVCAGLLTDCKQELADFAENFIKIPSDCHQWDGACGTQNEISRSGAVGIGTATIPTDFKLAVRGGIMTEQLFVCKTEWCDFVFDDTFRLMPLKELSAFLDKNRHLPDCTPGATIENGDGFFIDQETVTQQKKIEEIFLHLIGLNNRINALNNNPIVQMGTIPVRSLLVSTGDNLSPKDNISQPEVVLTVNCYPISPCTPGASDGKAGVIPNPSNIPYNISWSGPVSGQMTGVQCSGPVIIPGLRSGSYNITVTPTNGGSSTTCQFYIASGTQVCDAFTNADCKNLIKEYVKETVFTEENPCQHWEGDPCSTTQPVYRLGTVGIGTSNIKNGFNLAVKGGIVTDKVRIELCESGNWCDYVFEPDYQLTPLEDIRKFLNANHHLPGSITAAEVVEHGGFEVKNVKIDHQKKVEESYLYLIEMNKKLENIQAKLNDFNIN